MTVLYVTKSNIFHSYFCNYFVILRTVFFNCCSTLLLPASVGCHISCLFSFSL